MLVSNEIDRAKFAHACEQGQAQFDSIKEMVEQLEAARYANEEDGDENGKVESAEQCIHEDALSVEVRSGWHAVGDVGYETPSEYRILLCTGGPAVQIVGNLSEHGEPETARMEVQDWFTPWTEFRPQVGPDNYDSESILLTYARCFYFGE